MWILIGIIVLLIAIFNGFLYLFQKKISVLEKQIKTKFVSRTNLIPSIFEISRPHITRHEEIFREILRLRKIEFTESENNKHLHEMIHTEGLIHHELNFIFRVCNTQQKLLREGKFIYLRALIVDKSIDLGKDIELYRKVSLQYNKLVGINRFCVIGLFLPIELKNEI